LLLLALEHQRISRLLPIDWEASTDPVISYRTQLVPCVAEDPTVQVTQFCRTPSWLLPPVCF
jgi:hypothetical protein